MFPIFFFKKKLFKDLGTPPPFTVILNMMTIIGVCIQIELKIAHSFPIIAFGNTIYQNNNLSYFWSDSTLTQTSLVCQYSLVWISSLHEMGWMIVPLSLFSLLPALALALMLSHSLARVMRHSSCYRHRQLLLRDFSVMIVPGLHPCRFPCAACGWVWMKRADRLPGCRLWLYLLSLLPAHL